jgi:hypothetical protein
MVRKLYCDRALGRKYYLIAPTDHRGNSNRDVVVHTFPVKVQVGRIGRVGYHYSYIGRLVGLRPRGAHKAHE